MYAAPVTKDTDVTVKIRELAGLGDSLGPIGLTIGGDTQVRQHLILQGEWST